MGGSASFLLRRRAVSFCQSRGGMAGEKTQVSAVAVVDECGYHTDVVDTESHYPPRRIAAESLLVSISEYAADTLLPLRMLAPGQRALIGALVGQADHAHRLEEMGLRRGETVEMVQPGSPCIVRVAGTTLCFRDCDLVGILVEVTPQSKSAP